MRLRPEKIERLAELVYDSLKEHKELKLNGERETILFAIRGVITEDMEAEEAIEAEARKILDDHEDDMRRMGGNLEQMLRKTKQTLARDRGMVL